MDKLHELKQSASALEDENRELREKLRFKGEAYEFRSPLWDDKAHPDRPLCPKCHAKQIIDGPVESWTTLNTDAASSAARRSE
jgi:hypothetical protein